MKYPKFIYRYTRYILGLCVMLCLSHIPIVQAEEEQASIVELTQTGCQFLEPEAKNYQYQTTQFADCKKMNQQSGESRLQKATTLRLKPGKYIFRVSNKNVPYVLGFWLRGAGLQRITLPSVSGGGLSMGSSKDYSISLEAGHYYYSCPLNPTLDYSLVVE